MKTKCDKCGSEDVVVTTWYNPQEMCNEYFVRCNKCGNQVSFKGERWI